MFSATGLPVCEMRLPLPYAISSSMVSFFLPAMVMVILYTKLYLYARKHVRSIKTQLQQATSFLIMQLASEKIREVIVPFWFLVAESRIVLKVVFPNGLKPFCIFIDCVNESQITHCIYLVQWMTLKLLPWNFFFNTFWQFLTRTKFCFA